ncbi:hypothetical protein ACIO3R_38565 [Streptomyces sp. NPDC087428]|uniref:hypothetical protein n=1 Tax=Streptomyces sp. NPDC087428 TaxID=3365788 RepID=UPI0038191C30
MRTRTRTRYIAAAVGVTAALAFGATACSGKFSEPFKDAPRSGKDNGAPADVIRMPDGFSNAASKCDGPNRVYVLYHGDKPYGDIAIVSNDPRCTK